MLISSEDDLKRSLEHQPVSRFHINLTLMCLAILTLDGFDMAVMGFTASVLIDEWHITHEEVGVAMSAGLLGLAGGAIVGGRIADAVGRRKTILVSVVFFGIMSLLTAAATSLTMLIVLRFLTGVGLGAAQPNTATLISEYAPAKRRSVMVCIIYCGITLGGALAGLVARDVIPVFGWQGVFVFGGVIPLALVIPLFFTLPESILFLWSKGMSKEYIARLLHRISGISAKIQFSSRLTSEQVGKEGALRIVKPPILTTTLTFWLGLFTNLMAVNFLSNWFPLIVKENGFTLADAALAGAIVQGGGTIGNILIGWAMDRFGYHLTMFAGLIAAVVFSILLTQIHNDFTMFCFIAFFLGLTVNSVNTGWTSLAARFYPTEIRATGTSAMTGVGRTGAIFGAFIGGVLLSSGLAMNNLFYFLAIPLLICAAAVIVNGKLKSNVI